MKTKEPDWLICILIRSTVNKIRLRLGYTLINRHGYTVYLHKGVQIMSNPKRRRPYDLDDSGWRVK